MLRKYRKHKPKPQLRGAVVSRISQSAMTSLSSACFMSDNTINAALRSLGYCTQSEITGHGFRATARTLIRERLGFDVEVIERHLAHESKEELGNAYDRAQFEEQRRQMI